MIRAADLRPLRNRGEGCQHIQHLHDEAIHPPVCNHHERPGNPPQKPRRVAKLSAEAREPCLIRWHNIELTLCVWPAVDLISPCADPLLCPSTKTWNNACNLDINVASS